LTPADDAVRIDARQQEFEMQYTLITPLGQIYTFYYQVTAQTFQQAYGGHILTADMLHSEPVTALAN
jgi:hypothetical protein